MRVKQRFWTDEEIGFLLAHPDWSAPRIAEELGRTATSVRGARQQARKGLLGTSSRSPWTEDEDAVLVASGWHATAELLTRLLPGRTLHSIHHRRQTLGMKSNAGQRPFDVCGRPLVAKTCLGCDHLLAGSWFSFQKAQNGWASYCRSCNSKKARESKERGVGRWTKDNSRDARERLQRLTLPRAENHGQPYTEADIEVLKDTSLTDLQKALRLKRTYAATSVSRRRYGFSSKPDGLGDPERDRWLIDNPNIPALQEAS